MKLTMNDWFGARGWRDGKWMALKLELTLGLGLCLLCMALGNVAGAQAISTTTVQGTVYLANGQVFAGTLVLSWPAFTTANGQSVAADSVTVTIAPDGFVSVNLAPNQGATPAGLYYTAVYYLGDGTVTTQYWVVPAAAQASLAQVQAQLMPAAQAVQAVSKAYVDQSIAAAQGTQLLAAGGTLTGPLYLNGDPTQPLQASNKHYVDTTFSEAVPLAGGNMTGALQTPAVNGKQSPLAGSSQTTLQAAVNAAGTNGAVEIPPTYTGTDSFANPNGVYVKDLRPTVAQQQERSVKEFGAVCDGATDDTNALQSALNYANSRGVSLTIPQGTCKTRALNWRGESIGGLGKQVSALMGFPGQDVLATGTDSVNLLSYTRLHDLTIYVDQSVDVSCSAAKGRASAGICGVSRLMENNSIFSPGGNGLTGTQGTGAAWAVGNCAIAMPAATGAGGNGLRVAEIENIEIATTGVDPMAAQYPGVRSTHTCGMYLAQWPQWSEFRNIDIRGLNTGIAIPALAGTAPAGLNSDSNRWQNITIQATHAFTAAAGSNNVLDNVVAMAGNSAAGGEPPTGLVLDLGTSQQGWTVRNAVVLPVWIAVQPQLAVTASGGAVTAVTAGPELGLGFDPYGTQVPLRFSGSCTAQAVANVNSNGAIGTVSVTQGGVGCSGTTTASVNVSGTWDTAAPVNLIAGQDMTFFAGNLLKGNGGYTVWNASSSQSNGTQLDGGGGNLPGGGTYAALVANNPLGTALQVDQFPGADFGARLQACLSAVSATYGGTCDARNFTGSLSMASNLTISTANSAVLLPCATISTSNQIIVTAGTRNVSLRGCALRGGTAASGSQGGTAFLYSGTGAMVQVGDPTYAADTSGFHMDNLVINTTAAGSATAQGVIAYRTQEMDLESLYLLGNQNQTGMTLDGTGNYTGGTFFDDEFGGFQIAVNAIGHQVSNAATTDWMNASAFVRLHIDCPTSAGSPIAGTYGINLQQGDGNTFTGGDVEGCNTALHLGANAQNNTIVGLRNENSNNQVVADAGSSYNNWMTGGTMFTGKLTDAGTRNSFLDTFHRSFNGLNGDWYGSQQDATVINHFRLGIGLGNERGLQDRYQTDFGYRWTTGLSDATAGEQFYQVLDELNSVNRLSIGQYNNGQSSTNNQTVVNAAGTGGVILNGSNNSGTGGVVFGSGGATETTVATIDHSGNAQFNGTLQVAGTSQSTGTMTVRNNSDSEVDYYLWPGLTASQKGSFTYKDWSGISQWFMVKDASNNWALNSAIGGLDSFKAYQSTNSGDTYLNASNPTGVVRVNYEAGAGAGFNIYGGNSSSLYASFTGTSAIKFPGLAAGSGYNCMQIDNSGYITNTGSACGTSSGGGSGTVGSATSGQIAYYMGTGTSIGGMNQIPLSAGGTGASTSAGALATLGAQATVAGLTTDGTNGILVPGNGAFGGNIAAATVTTGSNATTVSSALQVATIGNVRNAGPRSVIEFGATGNGATDDTSAVQAALSSGATDVYLPPGTYLISSPLTVAQGIRLTGANWSTITNSSTIKNGSTIKYAGGVIVNSACQGAATCLYGAINITGPNNSVQMERTIVRDLAIEYTGNLASTITAYSFSSGTLTLILPNTVTNGVMVANEEVYLSGLCSALSSYSGETVKLTGANSTSISINVGGSSTASGSCSGTAAPMVEGLYFQNARQTEVSNLYISGFNTGVEFAQNTWQSTARRLRIMNFTTYGIWSHDEGGEDSVYDQVFARSFTSLATGILLSDMVQNATLIDCDLGSNGYGLVLQQGATGGSTGTPYPMSATVIGGQFEDDAIADFSVSSSNVSASTYAFPDLTVIGGRACGNCANTSTKNTTAVVMASNANDISIKDFVVNGGEILASPSAWSGSGSTLTVTAANGFSSGDSVAPGTISCGTGSNFTLASPVTLTAATSTQFQFASATTGSGSSCSGNATDVVNVATGLSVGSITRAEWSGSQAYLNTFATGTGVSKVSVLSDQNTIFSSTFLQIPFAGSYGFGNPNQMTSTSQTVQLTSSLGSTPALSVKSAVTNAYMGINVGSIYQNGSLFASTMLADSSTLAKISGNSFTGQIGSPAILAGSSTGTMPSGAGMFVSNSNSWLGGYGAGTNFGEVLTPKDASQDFWRMNNSGCYQVGIGSTVGSGNPVVSLCGLGVSGHFLRANAIGTYADSAIQANDLPAATTSTQGAVTIGAGLGASGSTVSVNSQYRVWPCQDGVGENAGLPTSGWPTFGICYNDTGVTVTLAAIRCYVDNGSATTTIAVTDGSGNNLLSTSTLACSNSWATGSLNATTISVANGGYIKWTPTPDGTSKEITVKIAGTY